MRASSGHRQAGIHLKFFWPGPPGAGDIVPLASCDPARNPPVTKRNIWHPGETMQRERERERLLSSSPSSLLSKGGARNTISKEVG